MLKHSLASMAYKIHQGKALLSLLPGLSFRILTSLSDFIIISTSKPERARWLFRQKHFHQINPDANNHKAEDGLYKRYIWTFEEICDSIPHAEKEGEQRNEDESNQHNDHSHIEDLFEGIPFFCFLLLVHSSHLFPDSAINPY